MNFPISRSAPQASNSVVGDVLDAQKSIVEVQEKLAQLRLKLCGYGNGTGDAGPSQLEDGEPVNNGSIGTITEASLTIQRLAQMCCDAIDEIAARF